MPILLKRAYEKAKAEDGKRMSVGWLWPRGLKKEDAKIDEWLKNVSSSTKLRKWYSHDPDKWAKFKEKYYKELEEENALLSSLTVDSSKGNITFVFGSKEEKLNNAAALKEYIETKRKHSYKR